MRTRRGPALALLIWVGIALAGALPATLSAASPTPASSDAPSPAPSESPPGEGPPERPSIQVWLDRPLPTDAQPGSKIDVGATLWDTAGAIAAMGATMVLRALPADRAGEPSTAVAVSDWRGHYRGTVEVPASGLGGVEVGVTGTICENDVCRPDDWVFDMGGVGPPPEAPITALAEARIDVGDATLTAGRPTDIGVVLEPNADWDPAQFPLPGEIVVRAREARGPNVASSSLSLADAAARIYAGTLTIPEAGDLVLEAATDEDGGDATRFGTSMVRVPVDPGSGAGGDGTDPTNGQWGASGDEGLPTIVIVVMAIVAIAGVGVMLAGFRAGGR